MSGECGHAEVDGLVLALQGRVDLGELVLGAGEADLQALDLAEPSSRSASAMRSCRLTRISSSRLRWAGSGLKSEHLTHA